MPDHQVNPVSPVPHLRPGTIAPADATPRPKWPPQAMLMGYVVMTLIAIWSIWMIDGHVLQIARERMQLGL